MCPKLLEIGPITIYSYGLMVAIGFLTASYLLSRELHRKNMDEKLASTFTLLTLFSGVAGSKLLYLIENWEYTKLAPLEMAFSPSGLTYYGGFFLATISVFVYCKKKGLNFLSIADSISPGLILAYGIARLGCHFAGDGDYGFPTTLPWGTNYSNGTYPPSFAFRDFPEVTSQFPNGIVPDTTLCHPTPVYEFILCALLFFFMWKMRKKIVTSGVMFSLYLVLAGVERLLIEFIRLNSRILFGLSEAQLISVGLIVAGSVLYLSLKPKT
ncbi:MAG: prolipoprotein diacylglyceryl transferase [Ignavibacteriales bacterium]|nr:prolipoprotein diacylglyceryl transferase [Ignavibacteriales bacterium]